MPEATTNSDGILTREWYCFDKDDPVFLKEKVLSITNRLLVVW